jgi:hypothetical protein
MWRSSTDQDRFIHVNLAIVTETIVTCLVAFVFTAAFAQAYPAAFPLVAVAVVFAIGISLRHQWQRRTAAWKRLVGWSDSPLRQEGPLVVQERSDGTRLGTIDTRDHFTVRWEWFDEHRALYMVLQGGEKIFVSTLAPNAPDLLRNALKVANYPCVEWPNFDL